MIRGFLLVLKIVLVCAATNIYTPATGQSTAELAQKNLERQKWQRAYELLTKALSKDSLNVTAKYVLAQYFFSEHNPSFHLDSAYYHVLSAIRDFQYASLRQRDKLRRFPLDSTHLIMLRQQIEAAAFSRARAGQTEKAWRYFIDHFPLSSFLQSAIRLRDSIAYQDAVQKNTYQSFKDFFEKYPTAVQSAHAKQQYERLLFEAETSDKTLASFEGFLSTYPNSPYRPVVEQTIFEYKTVSGEWQAYIDYIRSYPASPFLKKAKDILFHLIPEQERSRRWPGDFTNDSLSRVIALEHVYLAPFLTNKKFGFMDPEANEIIPASADSIDQSYLCGNIVEDIIYLPGQIISKGCACILERHVTNIDDMGSGFLLIEGDACKRVIHKTGFQIGDNCIDDAKILNGKFIAILKADQWSVWTLAGKRLIENAEGVFNVKDVVGLKTNGKTKLLSHQTLTELPPPPERGGMLCDEAKSWNNDLIFVEVNGNVGLVDQSLTVFVEVQNQRLTPAFFGIIATDSAGSRLIHYSGKRSKTFTKAVVRDPWVAVKDSLWNFLDPTSMEPVSTGYDTVIFHGPFAAGHRLDSTHIFFTNSASWKGLRPTTIEFIPGIDSTAFLVIEQKNTKTIFNKEGKKLFNLVYDKIQHGGQDYFIVHRKEKKGLVDGRGRSLLPVEYDAIGTVNNGLVSLLRSMQFGLYDCVNRKRIPTSYQKNLVRYNKHVVVAFKDGQMGFIDWNNKPLSKFEFNEIEYWNDTTALVKKNSEWMIYEIGSRRVLLDKIKHFKLLQDHPSQKLAIVYQGLSHGVIDSKKGTIIPISFSYIMNVGSAEKPLYFTEKHVTEADIFVVIYYNDQGKLLRKEIYDQEDYERIYCNDQ